MASRHKATHNHDTDIHTVDILHYTDAMNATQRGLHHLEKKITELIRQQERKKALFQALECDVSKIHINHFQLKHFIKNTLKSNSEYYDFQSIFCCRLDTKKTYHYQEPLIIKNPVIH
jgi:negative regulator of sigma E activity